MKKSEKFQPYKPSDRQAMRLLLVLSLFASFLSFLTCAKQPLQNEGREVRVTINADTTIYVGDNIRLRSKLEGDYVSWESFRWTIDRNGQKQILFYRLASVLFLPDHAESLLIIFEATDITGEKVRDSMNLIVLDDKRLLAKQISQTALARTLDHRAYEYNRDTLLAEMCHFDTNGKIQWRDMYHYRQNRLTQITSYAADSTILQFCEYHYQNGLANQRICYTQDQAIISTTHWKYNDATNKTHTLYFDPDGSMVYRIFHTYGLTGKLTRDSIFSSEGKLTYWNEYEYKNNRIQLKTKRNDLSKVVGKHKYFYSYFRKLLKVR